MALSHIYRSDIEAPSDIAAASLRSDRFRLEREDDWRRLDAIVTALEKGRPRRITDDDLLDLPVLYRKTASSLAVARETSLDSATLRFLESLVQRAWFQIYAPRGGFVDWLRQFLGGGWSAAVRRIWLDICIALFVMIAGTAMGWLMVANDERWFYSLVPEAMASGRVPGASRAALAETLAPHSSADGLGVFAASLFSNNTAVSILAFALGFAFGIPTLLLLIYNTALLGAMFYVFAEAGLGTEFGGWLAVHGTTELGAILLAGAAGVHIGRTMAFPGDRSILAAMQEAGARAATVMAGCVIMLILAGLLESFARGLIGSTAIRYAIGGGLALFWVVYFAAFRPKAVR